MKLELVVDFASLERPAEAEISLSKPAIVLVVHGRQASSRPSGALACGEYFETSDLTLASHIKAKAECRVRRRANQG
jgi:hypothetical protein